MKKYWRCFVCNDIHYGLFPPGTCPTCKVNNAYIEIPSSEAENVLFPKTEMDKEAFKKALETFTEKNEFKVNPNKERVELLLEGMFNNEKNHGLRYCPCRLITKEREEDLKLICPCNFLIHETYQNKEDGECWCGLFVRRK